MASEAEIIRQIENIVIPHYYRYWHIGLTDDPDRRKIEHGNPKTWYQWEADSEPVAKGVESYLVHNTKMQGETGGAGWKYVYMFMKVS